MSEPRLHGCELCNSDGGTTIFRAGKWRVVRVGGAEGDAFPGYCRVIWNAHIKELTDLDAEDRRRFMEIVFEVEAALRSSLSPDKMNVASLGNLTPHLHWHIIPRFADDPAFCDKDGKSCKKRELTAQDYVYSYKRIMDPKTRGPTASGIEELNLIGLNELRKAADKPGGNFDYVKEIEGLRTLDRYTLQFKTSEPQPRLIYSMADGSVVGAVAREVVEKYGDKIMEHPVGTGPYKLDKWTRSSKIVLVRSPNFREQIFSAVPPADDVRALAIAAHLKGKRLPLIDRVEVSIIEEEQPRWLAFLGNEHDFYERLAPTFAYTAIPNNRLAPNLAKRGIEMERTTASDITIHYFNMQDPIVGGYTPEKVALRRAMSLGFNVGEEIRLPFRNQAVLAQSPFAPATFGYDPAFKTAMSEYDPLKAKALLDMYGYVDKDGDGWRDMPDGKPLVVEYATEPTGFQRERIEIWRKSMDAIGIKMIFKPAKWPENLKSARAGKLQMWGLANSASIPDSSDFLQLAYGPSAGQQNFPRFLNAEFDALYDQQKTLPDGPERLAVMQKAAKIWTAYMPIKVASHRVLTDMWHPWAIGYMRHPVANGLFWRFMDIDLSKLPPQ